MRKENNTKSWPEVIVKARQIEDPEERLNYLVQNQPYLSLHPKLTKDKLIVKPQYWQWWTKQGDEKYIDIICRDDPHYTTVKEAIGAGMDPANVVIGFYLANYSVNDSVVYWDDQAKLVDVVKWLEGAQVKVKHSIRAEGSPAG